MDCLRRNEKQGNDVGRCSICLCDYDFGDAVAELTCGSNLHQACLAQSVCFGVGRETWLFFCVFCSLRLTLKLSTHLYANLGVK